MSLKPLLPGNLLQVPSAGTSPVLVMGGLVNVPGFGWFDRVGQEVQIVTVVPDPLADIPLVLRFQTNNGNGVPSGLYQNNDFTNPAIAEGQTILSIRDDLFNTGLTGVFVGTTAPTLHFIQGTPVLSGTAGGGFKTNVPVSSVPASYSACYTEKENFSGAAMAATGGGDFKFFQLTFPSTDIHNRYAGVNYSGSNACWSCISYTYNEASPSNGTEVLYESGVQRNTRTGSMPSDSGFLSIGSDQAGSYGFNGFYSSLFVSAVKWTDAQRQIVENYSTTLVLKPKDQITYVGNSITFGTAATDTSFPMGNAFPSLNVQSLANPSIRVFDLGITSATPATMAATQSPQIFVWRAANGIVVVGEEVNQIGGGATALQTAQSLRDLCQQYTNWGAKVILWTAVTDVSSPNRVTVLACNALLLADFPNNVGGVVYSGASYASLLVDTGSLTVQLADGTHPTNTGHATMAAAILPAIQMLL